MVAMGDAAAPEASTDAPSPDRPRSEPAQFYVAGFWRRLLGASVDLAVVLAVALVLGAVAGAVSGFQLPSSRHRGIDFWIDLLLAHDPAFLGWLGLTLAVGALYALVFQTTMGRTPGMRVTKTRIIDLYGDPPDALKAGIRTVGYLLSIATLGLGFLWIGFDAEKRGAHDWLAGTYVVKD